MRKRKPRVKFNPDPWIFLAGWVLFAALAPGELAVPVVTVALWIMLFALPNSVGPLLLLALFAHALFHLGVPHA